ALSPSPRVSRSARTSHTSSRTFWFDASDASTRNRASWPPSSTTALIGWDVHVAPSGPVLRQTPASAGVPTCSHEEFDLSIVVTTGEGATVTTEAGALATAFCGAPPDSPRAFFPCFAGGGGDAYSGSARGTLVQSPRTTSELSILAGRTRRVSVAVASGNAAS